MHPPLHILNGNALKSQVENWLEGDLVTAHECLIEGPLNVEPLDDFFHVRSRYLAENYGGTPLDYWERVVPEFTRMIQAPEVSR